MMKHSLNRILSLVLCLTLAFSFASVVYADDAADPAPAPVEETLPEELPDDLPDYSDDDYHQNAIIKCMGYRIASGVIAQGAKADIELALYDSDYTYSRPSFAPSSGNLLTPTLSSGPRKMFITLGDCSFSQSPDDSAASYISYDNQLGCLIIHVVGCVYNGNGNTLSVNVGYQSYGHIRDNTFSVTISEAPNGESSGSSLAPTLLIDTYTLEPEDGATELYAGTPFALRFALFNASRSLTVQNLRVQVSGGEVFRQTSGTDTLYIEALQPQGSSEQSIPFTTSSDAQPGSYPVTLQLQYEYFDNGAKQSGSDTITLHLPLHQIDRVRCNRISVDPGYAGSELILNYSFINAGFTTLYNTEIQVYNGMDELIASKYVGTVESAKEIKGSDIGVVFYEAGEQAVRVVLQYQNAAMESCSIEESTTTYIEEYYEPVWDEPVWDEPILEEPEADWMIWLIIGGVVVLVAAGTVVLLLCLKRKKAKQLQALEEYDDEDL